MILKNELTARGSVAQGGRSVDSDAEVWVLLSGGIDSSACLAFCVENNMAAAGVFIDYGQRAAHRESAAALAIAQHFGVPLRQFRWFGGGQKKLGEIAGRNAFLLLACLLELPRRPMLIAIGIHSGTGYADSEPEFIDLVQSVVDMYEMGCVQIVAPFKGWSKQDVWEFAQSRRVPVELTYSCELGNEQPCGICNSCCDLEKLRACA